MMQGHVTLFEAHMTCQFDHDDSDVCSAILSCDLDTM